MTSLTDRYVHATTRELPTQRRAEIGRELRASITDQVDDRVASGEPPERAEHEVIAGLGDPMRLAASYSDRPLALIGPAAYPSWRRLLVLLLAIVVPIIAALAGVGAIVDGDSFGTVLGAAWVAAITVGVHLAVWVTVIFAVLERAGVFDTAPGAPATDGAPPDGGGWTPEQLPTLVDDPTVSRGETITAVTVDVALIAFLVYQRAAFDVDGEQMPILDPGLWSFWIPFMLVTLVASAALSVAIGVRGRATRTQAVAGLAISTAWSGSVILLAVTDQLLNPAFVAHFDWLTANVDAVNTGIAVVALLAWGFDVHDAYRRTRSVPSPSTIVPTDP
jgi:hypothetical protein